MKIREQRGTLEESLQTVQVIEPTLVALHQHIRTTLEPQNLDIDMSDIVIHPVGHDSRCGWDTFAVAIESYGVFGFIDQFPK